MIDIKNKYIPDHYDMEVFDIEYAKQVHDDNCDYNPYENKDYYFVGEYEDLEE